MEKAPTKSKGSNLFKYLQRPASFAVPKPPFSPGRRRRAAFSGPILPAAPNNSNKKKAGKQPGTPKEPSSPKVSCIGQIKKHKRAADGSCKDGLCMRRPPVLPPKPEKQRWASTSQLFGLKKMFRRKVRPSKKHEEDGADDHHADADVEMGLSTAAPAPMLGQMRRFTSKREGLGSFDWRKTQTVEEEDEDDDDVQERVMISHSGPILMGGGEVAVEPKKEVNIWKRRTAAPPKPLQLN